MLWFSAAALCLLAVGARALYYEAHRLRREPVPEALRSPVPLTTDPGFQSAPTFSPEGTRVAYTWREPGQRAKIYVKLIGSSEPVKVDDR